MWVAALVAGTANDLIFMALPLVDNFWQAQGMVMLTPRLPLYIPCVYVCFMYIPTVAVRRLGLPPLAAAALTGIVACLFYMPYDIVGAKFLWWTWHDTDKPIAARILGAPASSTLWILTFVGAFSWLIGWAIRKDPEMTGRGFARGLAAVAGLTTILMVVQITVLQQLDGGAPAYRALAVGVVIYAVLAWRGRASAQRTKTYGADRLLARTVILYFATLVLIMAFFDPAKHVSTGVHQTIGPCYVEAKDITGLTRHRYLCPTDYNEPFTLACGGPAPPPEATWYTVCGLPHESYARYFGGLILLGTLGALAFSFCFRRRGRM